MCVGRVFISRPNSWFLRKILVIKCQSICSSLQMAWFLLLIHFLGSYLWAPSRPDIMEGRGGERLSPRSALNKSSGRGGFKWASLRKGARNNLGTRYLLRQNQSCTWFPVRLLGLQGNWEPSYAEHTGVQPYGHNCDPAVKPTFHVRNGFIHFRGHESTQSGKYDLDLLTHHPINQEYKQKFFSLGRGNASRACTSSFFIIKARSYPFPLSSKSPRHNIWTWCQLSLLSGSIIVP